MSTQTPAVNRAEDRLEGQVGSARWAVPALVTELQHAGALIELLLEHIPAEIKDDIRQRIKERKICKFGTFRNTDRSSVLIVAQRVIDQLEGK